MVVRRLQGQGKGERTEREKKAKKESLLSLKQQVNTPSSTGRLDGLTAHGVTLLLQQRLLIHPRRVLVILVAATLPLAPRAKKRIADAGEYEAVESAGKDRPQALDLPTLPQSRWSCTGCNHCPCLSLARSSAAPLVARY